MSNHQEFSPKRSAAVPTMAAFLTMAIVSLIVLSILIQIPLAKEWLYSISALPTLAVSYAVWHFHVKKETVKAKWAKEHPLPISSNQFPLDLQLNTNDWLFLKRGNGEGWLVLALSVVFSAACGFHLFNSGSKVVPYTVGLSMIFLIFGYCGLVRVVFYRRLDIWVTERKLSPDEKIRILIRQPDKKSIPHLEIALINRLRDECDESQSFETLAVAPIMELYDLKPEADGRILDIEFEIPHVWPRTENFAGFPFTGGIITEVRLKQFGPWPSVSYNFPIEILNPAPSALYMDWPLGRLGRILALEKKPGRPIAKATLKATMVFIFTSFFGTIIFFAISSIMPKPLSGLSWAVWFLFLTGYFASLIIPTYKVWRSSYREAKKDWESIS